MLLGSTLTESRPLNLAPFGQRGAVRPWARRLVVMLCGLLLALIGSASYLLNLDEPRGPYWDENYYLTAVARYAGDRPQFASHPPLGLMLLAVGDRMTGANKGVDVSGLASVKTVSETKLPPGYQLWSVRLASALFGVAVVLTVYALLLSARFAPVAAAAIALLVAFETAFITQFRAAHLDAFQMEFALIVIGFMVAAAVRRSGPARVMLFAGAGAAAGAATMVKLDGALLAAAPAALLMGSLIPRWRTPRAWVVAGLEGLAFAAAAICLVFVVYGAQTLWCRRPLDYGAPAAAIDARFMSVTYQHYLDGRRPWSPHVVWAAARDSLRFMLNDQVNIGPGDPNGASPWLHPLGVKPITYRWDSQNGLTRYVQLVANPVNWTAGAVGLIAALALVAAGSIKTRIEGLAAAAAPLAPIIATALAFYVAHGLLGAHRVMYLYHGFLTQVLGLLCLPFLARAILIWRPSLGDRVEAVSWGFLAASSAAFLWLAPLAYHWPLSRQACDLRNMPFQIVLCRD